MPANSRWDLIQRLKVLSCRICNAFVKYTPVFLLAVRLVLMIANNFLAETRSLDLPEYNIVLAAGNIHL